MITCKRKSIVSAGNRRINLVITLKTSLIISVIISKQLIEDNVIYILKGQVFSVFIKTFQL